MKTPDLIGHIFGRLTVLRKEKNDFGNTVWVVRCTCGMERIFRTAALRSGQTKSCGCLKLDVCKERMHNMNMAKGLSSGEAVFNQLYRSYKQGAIKRSEAEGEQTLLNFEEEVDLPG